MKILVADDDPIYRRLLHATLTSWGYEVTTARDGDSAWALLRADDAPELAILDWMMPGLDGDQICRNVRQIQRDHYTYLLMLSSRGEKADLLDGLDAGADDYLSKPFDPLELRARLNTGRRIVYLHNELIKARDAMHRQATRDALTDLWNRAAILDILDRELGRAQRECRPVGVVLADLDHFKRVNDTYGHLAGDAVLREAGVRFAHALRPYDLIGRYGGEEFLIVLPGCDEPKTVAVCERLRTRIANEPFVFDDRVIPVTLSLGATVFAAPTNHDAVNVVRTADTALYRAKTDGRNRVVWGE